jgi:membrane protease YdiL (CAAX protease family)
LRGCRSRAGQVPALNAGHCSRLLPFAVFLVAYGNLASLVLGQATPAGWWPGVGIGLLLAATVLIWARRAPLTAQDLGLTRSGVARSAGIGVLVAIAAAIPALLILRFPPLVGGPVTYAPLGSLQLEALLLRVLVWMPLDTALPEELAFRGVLLSALRQRFADPWAMVLSAVPFTLWHGVILTRTLGLTNLYRDPVLLILGLTSAFIAVFVGGVLFATVRLATGHLAGSVLAHWAFNAALLLELHTLQP